MNTALNFIHAAQRSARQIRLSFVVGLLLLALSASPGDGADAVTGHPLMNVSGAGASFSGAMSADGRYLVFSSEANNLVSNDDSGPYLDLFLRDLQSGATTLLSVSRFGTGGGNGNSGSPSVSTNGQWIAFESAASNLVPGDTNGFSDVFVRNIAANTTVLISRNFSTGASGSGPSRAPQISASGRYVLFESAANNLVANDLNGTNDVFIYDTQLRVTTLVSVNSNGQSASGASQAGSLSGDATRAVFLSKAGDLTPGASNIWGDVFVRDFVQAQTLWASSSAANFFLGTEFRCFNPVMSADGQVVAFKAARIGALSTEAKVFRVNLQTSTTTLLTDSSLTTTCPQISSDGRYVAFESGENVVVFDATLQTTTVASVDGFGNAGGGSSRTPILSDDGRKVIFLSASGTLVSNAVPAGLYQIYRRDLDTQQTDLISVTTNNTGSSGDLGASLPVMSADGTKVAFDAADSQFVPNDLNGTSDVFVRSVNAETTALVSVREGQSPALTARSMSFLSPHCFSSNGQFLAFATMDSNLAARDTNAYQDIFIHDLVRNTNFPVSVWPQYTTNDGGSGPPVAGTNSSFRLDFFAHDPVVSGNGRYVAFVSERGSRSVMPSEVYLRDAATDSLTLLSHPVLGSFDDPSASAPSISPDGSLVAFQESSSQFPGGANVFLRRNGSTDLISSNLNGGSAGGSTRPLITPDSRNLLFYSIATTLTSDSLTSGPLRLFAHDLNSGHTRLLSFNEAGLPLNDTSTGAVVSANSRFVAFHTTNSQSIYRFDLSSPGQTNLLVCTNCSFPTISGDGRFVAYQSRDMASGIYQVFLSDLESNTVALVSGNRTSAIAGNGHSRWAQISPDARYLVFASEASDLVDNDSNQAQDIFVRDLATGTTMLLSVNALGTSSGNLRSSKPVLAPNGRTVAFQSFASDLVAGDYNNTRDIFVVQLASPDTDHDGLDDDWELAFFSTLARTGSDDFDQDGLSDRAEFLAGTDPTNTGSVLRVLTLTRLNGGSVTIFWSSVPGKKYDVQYKNNVADVGWTTLATGIAASSSTASTVDNSENAQRFYRVLLRQ